MSKNRIKMLYILHGWSHIPSNSVYNDKTVSFEVEVNRTKMNFIKVNCVIEAGQDWLLFLVLCQD